MAYGDSIFFDVGQGIKADSGHWYKAIQLLGTGGNAVTYLVVGSDGPHRGVLFALKVFRKSSVDHAHLRHGDVRHSDGPSP